MYWMKPGSLHKSLSQLPWTLQNPNFLCCIKMGCLCHMAFARRTGWGPKSCSSRSCLQQQPGVDAWGAVWSPSQRLCGVYLIMASQLLAFIVLWLLEKEETQQLIPLPDLSSINLSNCFFISFRLLTSVLLGDNEFCNSYVLWNSYFLFSAASKSPLW